MRPAVILRLARKEIVSTLRDTRAIVSNLVIPLVLVPVMMIGMPLLLGSLFEREQVTVTSVGVVGEANVPAELRAAFTAANLALEPVADADEAVRGGTVDVAVVIPTGFEDALADGGSAIVQVHSKVGNMKSELNASKVQQAFADYQAGVVAARLSAAGLDASVLQPVTVQTVDASSQAERSSGQLSWLIPFFIAIWTLTGGQMTAIDATAGEKERGTLEVLLVAPVRRAEVVAGKFIATMTFGLSAALMAILGIIIGGTVMAKLIVPRLGEGASGMVNIMGGSITLTPATVLTLVVSALLLSAFVSALLLGIAMFARSFKEAQSYVAPLSFLFVIPAVALQFKDLIGLSDSVYYVPVLNVLVLMDNVVRGVGGGREVLITWAVMLAAVVLLLRFALRNFKRESVIF
ncbi:MAG: ABC transporter permease, partial [Trueperaceae bacterium]|nr:ABC transporter permease [Trueperaceae bacterium]